MKRQRRNKKAGVPPPPTPKVPSPKQGDLKEIYKKLITASITNRISALFEAVGWWDEAIKHYMVGAKMTPEQIKRFGQANKSRNLAIGAGTDQEREAALTRTISLLEGVWAKQHILSYKPYYKQYEESKVKLEAKEAAATQRFQTLLEALNAAFNPLDRTFHIVKQTNSGAIREFDGENKILISMSLAKELNGKIKQEGLLPVLFSEVNTIIKSAGIDQITDPNAPGNIKHVMNFQKMLEAVPTALDGILQYVNNQSKGKIFKQYSGTLEATATGAVVNIPSVKAARVKTSGTNTPRVPRQHTSKGGAKVGGRYAPGSAMAVLYEALEDQKVHALSEVFKAVSGIVNNPADRMRYLIKHGERSGKWKIIQQNNTIQMVIP